MFTRIAILLLVATAAVAAPVTPTPTATPLAQTPQPSPGRAAGAVNRLTRRLAAAPRAESGGRVAAPAAAVVLDPMPAPIVVGQPLTLAGSGFTAGSVLRLFVATAQGPVAYGPYVPSSGNATQLQWSVDPAIALGNGFATVMVINTDQGYLSSNTQSQLLFGDPVLNLPTLTAINGVVLSAADPSILGMSAHLLYIASKGQPEVDLTDHHPGNSMTARAR